MSNDNDFGVCLSAKARIVWSLRSALIGVPGISAAAAAAVVFQSWLSTPAVLWTGAAALFLWLVLGSAVLPVVWWRIWRYQLETDRIEIRRGLLIRKHTSIPMARVQHAESSHGPLLRMFGLSYVQIFTAGSVHQIPALPTDTADTLRSSIVELANRSRDDV